MTIFPKRIYAQYRNKTKFGLWINITKNMSQQFVDVFDEIRNTYDIDSQAGDQLDIIGRIVDQDRSKTDQIVFNVVQLSGNTSTSPQCGESDSQCSPLTVDSDRPLSDEYYRYLLRAKIVKNNSYTTIDDVLEAVKYIAPTLNVTQIIDNEDMTFNVEYNGEITELINYMLTEVDTIPRPAGVKFAGLIEQGT